MSGINLSEIYRTKVRSILDEVQCRAPKGTSEGGQWQSREKCGSLLGSDSTSTNMEEVFKEVIAKAITKEEITHAREIAQAEIESRILLTTVGDTKSINTDSRGNYTADRLSLHEKIIGEILADQSAPKQENPSLVFIGGPPGAGKSTSISSTFHKNKIVVEADAVKAKLPEYNGRNAAVVHLESKDIADKIFIRSLKSGAHVVFDSTMGNYNEIRDKYDLAKANGYRVEARFVDVGVKETVRRVVNRFLQTGRYVPLDAVKKNARKPYEVFSALRDKFDSWLEMNNEVPIGHPPKVIGRSGSLIESFKLAKDPFGMLRARRGVVTGRLEEVLRGGQKERSQDPITEVEKRSSGVVCVSTIESKLDEAKKRIVGNLCVNTGEGSGGGFSPCDSSSMITELERSRYLAGKIGLDVSLVKKVSKVTVKKNINPDNIINPKTGGFPALMLEADQEYGIIKNDREGGFDVVLPSELGVGVSIVPVALDKSQALNLAVRLSSIDKAVPSSSEGYRFVRSYVIASTRQDYTINKNIDTYIESNRVNEGFLKEISKVDVDGFIKSVADKKIEFVYVTKDGKIPSIVKAGNHNSVYLNSAELFMLGGHTLHHNHPLAYPLSGEDVTLAHAAKMKAVVAYGFVGDHVVTFKAFPPKGGRFSLSAVEFAKKNSEASGQIFALVKPLVDDGLITEERANYFHHHARAMLLDAMGVIKYEFNIPEGVGDKYTVPKEITDYIDRQRSQWRTEQEWIRDASRFGSLHQITEAKKRIAGNLCVNTGQGSGGGFSNCGGNSWEMTVDQFTDHLVEKYSLEKQFAGIAEFASDTHDVHSVTPRDIVKAIGMKEIGAQLAGGMAKNRMSFGYQVYKNVLRGNQHEDIRRDWLRYESSIFKAVRSGEKIPDSVIDQFKKATVKALRSGDLGESVIDEAKKRLTGNLCVNTGQGSGGGFSNCGLGDTGSSKTATASFKSEPKISGVGRTPTDDEKKALKIPPAYKDVKVYDNQSLAWTATDAKGRKKYGYTEEWSKGQKAQKFARVQAFAQDIDKVRAKVAVDIDSEDPKIREAARVVMLIDKTFIRIGSNADTKADKQAYGASTLLVKHAKIDHTPGAGDDLMSRLFSGNVKLSFIGKKGVRNKVDVADAELARVMFDQVQGKGPNDTIFNVSNSYVNDYLSSICEGCAAKYTAKDFRTYHGTRIAFEAIAKKKGEIEKIGRMKNAMLKSGTASEVTINRRYNSQAKKIFADVKKKVSSKLGNTPAIAFAAYIDSTVWQTFHQNGFGDVINPPKKVRAKKEAA